MKKVVNLGLFNVNSGSIVISDPCYELDGHCQEIVKNVANGEWVAEVKQSNEGDWGIRNAELIIYHKDNEKPNDYKWKYLSNGICVDSGQAGFYDVNTYRNDDIVSGEPMQEWGGKAWDDKKGDKWYRNNCEITLNKKEQAGVVDGGVVSSSGFGDGSYGLYSVVKDNMTIGMKVVFISDECGYCEENISDCKCF